MDWGHRIQTQTDIAYGPFPLQRLDLTLQIERVGEPVFNQPLAEPRPLLVWYHGGGWIQGDKSTQWNNIVPFLARGWHVANVNYRQGPGTAPGGEFAVAFFDHRGRGCGFFRQQAGGGCTRVGGSYRDPRSEEVTDGGSEFFRHRRAHS